VAPPPTPPLLGRGEGNRAILIVDYSSWVKLLFFTFHFSLIGLGERPLFGQFENVDESLNVLGEIVELSLHMGVVPVDERCTNKHCAEVEKVDIIESFFLCCFDDRSVQVNSCFRLWFVYHSC